MSHERPQIGPYELLEPLGKGGMGVVYRARHIQSGVMVAIKTIRVPRPAMVQIFQREIQGLAQLRHPGIVQILADGVEDGRPWYAMDLLQGETLSFYWSSLAARTVEVGGQARRGLELSTRPGTMDSLMDRWWTVSLNDVSGSSGLKGTTTKPCLEDLRGIVGLQGELGRSWTKKSQSGIRPRRFSAAGSAGRSVRDRGARRFPAAGGFLPTALELMWKICLPLAYLHGEGMVHRDLKPDNILVDSQGWPVLVDFGLLSRFGGTVGREALELSSQAAGTVFYMSPEQIRSDPVDAPGRSLRLWLYSLRAGDFPPGFSGKDHERAASTASRAGAAQTFGAGLWCPSSVGWADRSAAAQRCPGSGWLHH